MRIEDLTPKTAIGKAILKLRELEDYPVTPQHAKACRLGIEALERLKELRNAENPYQNLELSKGFNRCRQKIREPLPSETEGEQ